MIYEKATCVEVLASYAMLWLYVLVVCVVCRRGISRK